MIAIETLHNLNRTQSNDRNYTKSEISFITNGLQAVYSIFPLLTARFKSILDSLLSKLQQDINQNEKFYSEFEEFRRQVFIGQQLFKNYALLNEDQIDKYYKKKLQIEELLEQETGFDLHVENDIFHLEDENLGQRFELQFFSNNNQIEQLYDIKNYFANANNLRNLVLEYPPLFIDEEKNNLK